MVRKNLWKGGKVIMKNYKELRFILDLNTHSKFKKACEVCEKTQIQVFNELIQAFIDKKETK
jgi:hypothetical protein